MSGRLRGTRAAVAACLALAGGGCGTDDAKDQRRFTAEADRVCAMANAEAARIAERIAIAQRGSDPATVYRDVARLTREQAAQARTHLDRLDALAPPREDRDEVKAWIAGQRRRQALVDGLARAFAARDDATVARLSQQVDVLASDSAASARRLGLRDCARGAA